MPEASRIKSLPDTIFGLVGIAGAVWLFVAAPEHAQGLYDDGVQPWTFPRLLLALFALLCSVLVWRALRFPEPRSDGETLAETGEPAFTGSVYGFFNQLAPIALTTLYIVSAVWFGFLISTFVVSTLYMIFLGVRIWKSVISAAALTALLYYLFGVLLHIPLPAGHFFQ